MILKIIFAVIAILLVIAAVVLFSWLDTRSKRERGKKGKRRKLCTGLRADRISRW